jgi:sec-independent protein translocase protein TatB
MFNVGGGELIVIMLIALIVLGPQRLPGAARQIGKTMGDLRRLSTGFQNEVRSAINDVDDLDQVAARRNLLARDTVAQTPSAADRGPAPASRPPRTRPLEAAPLVEPAPAPRAPAKKKATASTTKKATSAKKATKAKAPRRTA